MPAQYGIYLKKGCAQVECHVTIAQVPKWHRVHQLVLCHLKARPKSTDINWEQAQQESATILNVLSAPTPALMHTSWEARRNL